MKPVEEEARVLYLRFRSRLADHSNAPYKRSFHPNTRRKSSTQATETFRKTL